MGLCISTNKRTGRYTKTLLVHLGYLTYDKNTNEVFIPNQEIAQEFIRTIKISGWDGVIFCCGQRKLTREKGKNFPLVSIRISYLDS